MTCIHIVFNTNVILAFQKNSSINNEHLRYFKPKSFKLKIYSKNHTDPAAIYHMLGTSMYF